MTGLHLHYIITGLIFWYVWVICVVIIFYVFHFCNPIGGVIDNVFSVWDLKLFHGLT